MLGISDIPGDYESPTLLIGNHRSYHRLTSISVVRMISLESCKIISSLPVSLFLFFKADEFSSPLTLISPLCSPLWPCFGVSSSSKAPAGAPFQAYRREFRA